MTSNKLPKLVLKSQPKVMAALPKNTQVNISYDDVPDDMGLYDDDMDTYVDPFPYSDVNLINAAEAMLNTIDSAANAAKGAPAVVGKMKQAFTNIGAIKVIINELRQLMTNDPACTVVLTNNNIYEIGIKLGPKSFSPQCSLRRQLNENDSYVEIQMKLEPRLYPFYPPKVRLISPRFRNQLIATIATMDFLKVTNWNPICSLKHIIDTIKTILERHGEIDQDNLNPYDVIESVLIDMAVITETSPRINSLINSLINVPELMNTGQKLSILGQPMLVPVANKTFWKAGTGFANDSTKNEWDPKIFHQIKQEQAQQVVRCILDINKRLAKLIIESNDYELYNQMLSESCMIPYLKSYYSQTGLLDMFREIKLFSVIFDCMQILNSFEFMELFAIKDSDTDRSLYDHLRTVHDDCQMYIKNLGSIAMNKVIDAQVLEEKSIVEQFILYFDYLKVNYEKYTMALASQAASEATDSDPPSEANANRHAGNAGHSSASSRGNKRTRSKAKSKVQQAIKIEPKVAYIQLLRDQLFSMVPLDMIEFLPMVSRVTPTYTSTKSAVTVNKEILSLRNSLPLTFQSTIFHRTCESNTKLHKFIITGPEGTPYESGCFVFIMCLPNDYPEKKYSSI
jgi:ubiquitin-protein ligase